VNLGKCSSGDTFTGLLFVDLQNCIIVVKKSRSGRHIPDNKSRKPRVFSISPRLAERLQSFVNGKAADEPLFRAKKKRFPHKARFPDLRIIKGRPFEVASEWSVRTQPKGTPVVHQN
jgi:hypothetical protein